MVYRKWIKRDGKRFGPYYYESYRDSQGNVKTKYVAGPEELLPKEKKFEPAVAGADR